ncbi:MAG: tRNA threonylcarbamoyl adenosine modification protein (Sua5/YciO/YrdC/YwlC family) [Flavobacteriales bacterium]|jgi:tRNA threonylcarbamoyl adenosine modification protein (Sua5/YciO/YrdC/YwlC family)
MLIKLYPENPDPRKIEQIVNCLQRGGVIIYPTDTIYSIGCDLNHHKAFERVAKLKGIKPEKAQFSIICNDLSMLAFYSKNVNTPVYKLMKRALPGPYTFILNASSEVPKLFKTNKKTVGIRVPDLSIPRLLAKELTRGLIATSVHDDDEVIEYTTDPELIHEKYGDLVDIVIDGGYGHNLASTIIDCTEEEPTILREGAGDINILH